MKHLPYDIRFYYDDCVKDASDFNKLAKITPEAYLEKLDFLKASSFSLSRLWDIHLELSIYSVWFKTMAGAQLANGEKAGWMDFKLGSVYEYISLRIELVLGDEFDTLDVPTLGALSLFVVREPRWAQCLIAMIGEKQSQFARRKPKQYLLPYAECLALIAESGARPRGDILCRDDLGPYRGIFTNWDNPNGMQQAVREACDYHLARRSECVGASDEQFSVIYNIVPVEIFALWEVRRALGLAIPKISHPLLDTPVGLPPIEPIEIKDQLYRNIVKAFGEFDRPTPKTNKAAAKSPMSKGAAETPAAKGKSSPAKPKTLTAKPKEAAARAAAAKRFEAALLRGDAKAAAGYYDDKHRELILDVDWRAQEDELADWVAEKLPEIGLESEFNEDFDRMTLRRGKRKLVAKLEPPGAIMRYKAMLALNKILAPDWEFRAFRITLGSDMSGYLLRPAKWWKRMERASRGAVAETFAKLESKEVAQLWQGLQGEG